MLLSALGLINPFPLTSAVPVCYMLALSTDISAYLFCYRTQLRTNDFSSIQRDYLLLLY